MLKCVTLSCRLRRRWPLVVMAVCGVSVAVSTALCLRINTTASMAIRPYRAVPPRLERGALMMFCLLEESARLGRVRGYLHRGSCADGCEEIVKEIAAVAGDRVAFSHAGLVVIGHAVPGNALQALDPSERALPHAAFGWRVIARRALWVLGLDHGVRRHSRYFGPVPTLHVRAGAVALLTCVPGADQPEVEGDQP